MLFLFSLILKAGAQEISINYPDFSDVSKWQLNGEPKANSMKNKYNETVLRLTPPEYHTYGTAFLKDAIPLEDERGFRGAFSAFFSFRIGDGQGIDGADGLTFTIQTIANDVGSFGGGLGYDGIDQSVAVEFDTYKNSDRGDVDASHVGVDTNGSLVSIVKTSVNPPMDDYRLLYAWVDYNGDTKLLEIRVSSTPTRPDRVTTSTTIDIPKIIGSKNAFIGFTAATGESWNAHEILSFSFTNRFKPYSYTLSLSANPDTIIAFGDTVTVAAAVVDEFMKKREDLASLAKWSLVPAGNSQAVLLSSAGKSVKVVPTTGGTKITIEAAIDSGDIHLKKQIVVVVKQLNYQLRISAFPDTIARVGDTVTLSSNIIDEIMQKHPEMAKQTKWTIADSGGGSSVVLVSSLGMSVKVVPAIGGTRVLIEATVDSGTIHLKQQITIIIKELNNQLNLSASPDTIITLGDTITLSASIIDELMQAHPMMAKLTSWAIVSSDGNPLSVLLSNNGSSVKLLPSQPSSRIVIEASVDSANVHLKKQISVRVKGLTYSLLLKAAPDTVISRGDTVTLSAEIIDNLSHDHPKIANLTKWKLVSTGGNPSSILLSDSGATIKVVPVIALSSIVIEATVDSASVHLTQQITLRVKGIPSVPCVKAAILDSISENRNPTLLLVFNEQINTAMLSSKAPSDVLLYTSTNHTSANTVFSGSKFRGLNNSSFNDSIIVELGSNGVLIIPFLDSIKIASGTVNQSGIAPQPENAKNVVITTNSRRINISSSTNPFTTNTTIDPRIISFYNIKNPSSGTVISIFSIVPLNKERDGSFGRATIYDATGNVVKKDVVVEGTSVNAHYYHFEWNGLNNNSRKVGNGTYLAIVQVQDIYFQKSNLRYKIGVKSD
jgi:hypothetical protein